MTASEFLRTLEQALEIDPGRIAGHESLNEIEWWDSMAALTFMAVADQELHVEVSAQLQQCKTVTDLLALFGDRITR